jgi:catechol 2,3-dioxygenase-like lactoylglutathione lyase family enzyme
LEPTAAYADLYHADVFRLRQVVVAARDLDSTVDSLCTELKLRVCFHDPGVAEFGLHNALLNVGDQFIEVVSPIADNTAAGRLLDRRKASVTAYMVMFEVDDLDARMDALTAAGVRIVWSGDYPMIRGRHLHPADVGGAIVSLDQTDPPGSWLWGGPTWTAHIDNSVVSGIAGYTIAADDPAAVTTLWSLLGLLHSVRFIGGAKSEIELVATDRSNVGQNVTIDQVTLRLV